MKQFISAMTILAMAFASPAFGGQAPGADSFEPRNECRDDPEAAAFLDAINRALEVRDSAALVALAADDVHLDFGGGTGKDELRARLDGTSDGFGDLWSEIAVILTLGCDRDAEGMLTLPWYFAQDFGDRDPFDTMLVIRPAARLRASPEHEAETVATLSWNAVGITRNYDPEADFNKVVLPGRPGGFVETAALRSMVDYRLIAEKTDEGWKITAFIAGD